VRALGQAASGFGPNGAGRFSAARVPGDSHRDLRNSRRHRIAGAAICALAAIGLTLLLIAVLPANVRAAREGITIGGKPPTPLVARSLIQGIFLTGRSPQRLDRMARCASALRARDGLPRTPSWFKESGIEGPMQFEDHPTVRNLVKRAPNLSTREAPD